MSSLEIFVLFFLVLLVFNEMECATKNKTGAEAEKYLKATHRQITQCCRDYRKATWDFQFNESDETIENLAKAFYEFAATMQGAKLQGKEFPWQTYTNPEIKRKFIRIFGKGADMSKIRVPHLNVVFEESNLASTITKTFNNVFLPIPENAALRCENTSSVCLNKNSVYSVMKNSRNYEELLHYWKQYREKVGRPIARLYQHRAHLRNVFATCNGFESTAHQSVDIYEIPNFFETVDRLYKEIEPLYSQLHAYIRKKLRNFYGKDKVPARGPIPAHIIGNMWSESWANIAMRFMPFPEKVVNIEDELVNEQYTIFKIMKLAESFATSIGFKKLDETFWKTFAFASKATIPSKDCEPLVWDLCDNKDFGIRTCDEPSLQNYLSLFYEMGFLLYTRNTGSYPYLHRYPEHPIFIEAISETFAGFARSRTFLEKFGLSPKRAANNESDINRLFSIAMEMLPQITFFYAMDMWRYEVHSEQLIHHKMNSVFEEYMIKYHGISSPVNSSKEDFYPGAYCSIHERWLYFIELLKTVLHFQIHEGLCKADFHDSLHLCDIYGDQDAGDQLKSYFENEPFHWKEKLIKLTDNDTDQFEASSMLRYFKPLMEWLKKENKNEFIGWKKESKTEKIKWQSKLKMYSIEEHSLFQFWMIIWPLFVTIVAMVCCNRPGDLQERDILN